ncbi:hypothetical protein [Microbacterium luteum]|uniref:hypothetical protein n=1 Tax=Microbacterium luteum TaxID=2782167 RepID=UPI0018896ECD|nr:hypothetical protein [Microbacterium luteum]
MSIPLIVSAPPLAAPVAPLQWRGITSVWTGHDGSVWDLVDQASGAVLYRKGVEGLHFPRIVKNASTSRAISGKRLRGWRAESRDVFWPLYLWADGSDEWLARHGEFFDTIHPEKAGTWTVDGGRGARTLELTGVFDETHVYELDPLIRGWALYDIALEAAQPFWKGKRIRRGPWQAPASAPFFTGPPFTISSSSNFASASIPNPGDVDAWGIWWAVGPLTEIELGVGDTLIRVPFPVADGEMLRIDTDPRRPTALLGDAVAPEATDLFVGDDVTRDLGLQDYATIPPASSVPLAVAATGAGSIFFDLIPLYFRAF